MSIPELKNVLKLKEKHSTDPKTARKPGESLKDWLKSYGVDPSHVRIRSTEDAWHVSDASRWGNKEFADKEIVTLKSGIPNGIMGSSNDSEFDENLPEEDHTTPRVSFSSDPYKGVQSIARSPDALYHVFKISKKTDFLIPVENPLKELENSDNPNFCYVPDAKTHDELWYVDDKSLSGVQVVYYGTYAGKALKYF